MRLRHRAIARLLTVCAVLAGLLAMHGLAEASCGGTDLTAATMTAAAMTGHSDDALIAGPAHDAMTQVSVATSDHESACVSTLPPRELNALLALLSLAAAVTLASYARFRHFGHQGRTGPRASPRGGMELLTTLCVSRT